VHPLIPPRTASTSRAKALLGWILAVSLVYVLNAADQDKARAGTAGPWSPPTTISNPRQEVGELQVVADQGAGSTTAVWVNSRRHHRSVIQSASRQPGGTWSAPRTISPTGSFDPAVAVNARGEAIAVWKHRTGHRDDRRMVDQAASRSSDGTWSAAVTLSKPGDPSEPRVAINDSGEAVTLWEFSRLHTDVNALQSASRTAAGAWSAPTVLPKKGPTLNYEGYFQIVIDAAGEATAVWARFDPGHSSIPQTASRPAGGDWSQPIELTRRVGQIAAPLLVDAAGEAVALWERDEYDGREFKDVLESASRQPGGAWSAPVPLVQEADSQELAVNGAGRAIAIWEAQIGRGTLIQSASRPLGGAWSKAIDVFRRRPPKAHPKSPFDIPAPTGPRVAIGPTGEALATWEGVPDGQISTALLPAGGSWSARVQLINPKVFGIFENPHPVVSASGEALVVWEHFNGSHNVIESSSRPPAAG